MDTTTETGQHFSIKTDVFEGPLDLLLDLVEKRKLLINDISLAAVTDEYLAHVSRMQELSLPGTTQFVQLAATLLLIKSKSLLPVLELTTDEEAVIDNLEERLKVYQVYRDAATLLVERFGNGVMHNRTFVADTTPLFTPDTFTEPPALQEAMYRVLSALPMPEKKPRVSIQSVISLEEMITRLQRRIEAQARLQFSDLLEQNTERVTIIVGFLAVLESVKQGQVIVSQTERFADMTIEADTITAPKYY